MTTSPLLKVGFILFDKMAMGWDGNKPNINSTKKIELIINDNKNVESIKNNKISIIDCYNFSEVANKSGEIIRKYEENLITGKTLKVQK